MSTEYYIALDVHKAFTEMAVVTTTGKIVRRDRCDTAIPNLVEMIDKVRRPRKLTFEEGPMSGWLARNLEEYVDELIVCDPRRNALIAKEGDKDDPIDAEKMAQLYRGNFLRKVHQPDDLSRALLKQNVGFYYDRTRERVRQGLQLVAQLRRHGVFEKVSDLVDDDYRGYVWRQLPQQTLLQNNLNRLWSLYSMLLVQEDEMRIELHRAARRQEPVRRFEELPGIGWLRALTYFVYIDTPFRFKSPAAINKYCGIGLERRHSGSGAANVRVVKQCNRRLKCAMIGAARTASGMTDTPFGEKYQYWTNEKCLEGSRARRNLARCLVVTLWGIWKTGDHYDPAQVTGAGLT
jgi:transposase